MPHAHTKMQIFTKSVKKKFKIALDAKWLKTET